MIISVPPLRTSATEDKNDSGATHEAKEVRIDYSFQVVPADGVRTNDDQYISDPDEWFRSWGEFEDLIKIKR